MWGQLFLAYLDSSGRPSFADPENYVLASIVTNERHWQTIDNAVKQVKLKHFPQLPDSSVELHAKDMINHNGIFSALSWDKIYSILDDVFALIADPVHELAIIATLINKSKLKKTKEVELWAYRLLLERIQGFIETQNSKAIQSNLPIEFGIMIMDSEGLVKDQHLRNRLYDMLRYGTFYSRLTYLIEDPLFTDSKWRNLSQLSDCIAYCVRKHYRQNTASYLQRTVHMPHWSTYFKQIETRFYSLNNSYIGVGLKIWP
jgi:hypothetical protein